jgi:hypothetical protein
VGGTSLEHLLSGGPAPWHAEALRCLRSAATAAKPAMRAPRGAPAVGVAVNPPAKGHHHCVARARHVKSPLPARCELVAGSFARADVARFGAKVCEVRKRHVAVRVALRVEERIVILQDDMVSQVRQPRGLPRERKANDPGQSGNGAGARARRV